jgi:N-hydroxyarylamine O-acetyltransferase
VTTPHHASTSAPASPARAVTRPPPLEDGATLESGEWRWRLGRDGDFWVLHAGPVAEETELYAFRPDEPHYPSDFEVANFYVSEYPQSPFRHHVLVQRTTGDRRIRLEDHPPVTTVAELVTTLRDRIGIEITPEDTEAVLRKLAT